MSDQPTYSDDEWYGTVTYPMIVVLRRSDESDPFAYVRCERFSLDKHGEIALYREVWQGTGRPYHYEEVMRVNEYSSYLIMEIPEEEPVNE